MQVVDASKLNAALRESSETCSNPYILPWAKSTGLCGTWY